MVGTTVSLDLLPLKRVQAIDEGGLEHLPPERTLEEKSRLLLQRLDFEESEEKDAKRIKSVKESAAQLKWPWQGLVESLQLAQQELLYILDFLTHVEANDAIMVTNMIKPKQALHEACSELALRASAKLYNFKKVGKYLRQTAKTLEQQVDREAGFYGALMRLQQNWKVKRLRSISTVPGGNAGFTIDLSYPHMSPEMMWGLSGRSTSLYSIDVEQNSNGLLFADLPNHCMNTLHLQLKGPHIPHRKLKDEEREKSFVLSGHENEPGDQDMEKEADVKFELEIGKAVKTGTNIAHSILRRIQMAVIHEQIFEWTVREALQLASGLVVTSVEERCLQLSLGHSCELVLELKSTDAGPDWHNIDIMSAEDDKMEMSSMKLERKKLESYSDKISLIEKNIDEIGGPFHSETAAINFWKEMSSFICLEQAFYCSAFVRPLDMVSSAIKIGQSKGDGTSLLNKPKDFGNVFSQDAMIFEVAGPLKQFSLIMHHRIFGSRVAKELERLARGVPYVFFSYIPTWNARITAWKLTLSVPKAVGEGWKMKMVSWGKAQKRSNSDFYLKVILCDATLCVEGLEATGIQDNASSAEWKRSLHRCNLSELSGLLLCQLAGQLVQWLHEEASVMGLDAKRNFFSLVFRMKCMDEFVILACLDSQAFCINWWLHVQRPNESDDSEENDLNKSQARRCLGPLKPETLRSILVDLLSYNKEES